MPQPSAFKVGDRVIDKRDKQRVVGTLLEMRRHTNGSPKWVVQWPEGRYWQWEVDLRPADPVEAA